MHCCSPTRAALLTGRYPIRYGLQTNVIPASKAYGLDLAERILPQYLAPLGYRSHAIGKVGTDPSHLPAITSTATPNSV